MRHEQVIAKAVMDELKKLAEKKNELVQRNSDSISTTTKTEFLFNHGSGKKENILNGEKAKYLILLATEDCNLEIDTGNGYVPYKPGLDAYATLKRETEEGIKKIKITPTTPSTVSVTIEYFASSDINDKFFFESIYSKIAYNPIIIVSDKDTHFTTAIAQNAKENENIDMGITYKNLLIKSIVLSSTQKLNFDLYFYSKDTFDDTDADVNALIAIKEMYLASSGKQIGGAGLYEMTSELDTPVDYMDENNTNEIHLSLVNRSSTTKAAYDAGPPITNIVKIKFICYPIK